jgi:hypothetical protein
MYYSPELGSFIALTPFKHGAPIIKQPLDPRSIITHYKHLTIKNNPYNIVSA